MKASVKRNVANPVFDELLKTLLPLKAPFIYVDEVFDEFDNIALLDAREKKEFNVSHLQNAFYVGYKDFNIEQLPKFTNDKKIVVYCSVGLRSANIAEKIIKAGYKNIYNLYGGIFEWCNAKRPVYSNSREVNEVHAYSKIWKAWLRKGIKAVT